MAALSFSNIFNTGAKTSNTVEHNSGAVTASEKVVKAIGKIPTGEIPIPVEEGSTLDEMVKDQLRLVESYSKYDDPILEEMFKTLLRLVESYSKYDDPPVESEGPSLDEMVKDQLRLVESYSKYDDPILEEMFKTLLRLVESKPVGRFSNGRPAI